MVSETFVVSQIAGAVARGCDVDIFATSAGRAIPLPDPNEKYGLADRVYRLDAPRNALLRLYRVLSLLLVCGWRAPGSVVRAVNVVRYGKIAATLGLLHAVLILVRHGARQYDVIHAEFGTYGPLALQLVETGALKGRIVTSFRGYDATKFLQARPNAYDALFGSRVLCLPVSRALAARIIQAGCDPTRVRIHHSGIQCARFPYRERTRAGSDATKIAMVGRLVEKKGIGYGIKAVAQVIASGRDLSCTIIGEGPMRTELEQLIRDLDVGAHVRMVGSKSHDEVIRVMNEADILIAPSVTAGDGDEEGIPNTLKEAMAMGMPVIGTMHAGIPELIEDGVSGLLVPERDVAALSDRLKHLVDNPESWAVMGHEGRRRIEAEFDINKLSDELLGIYSGLLRESGQGEVEAHRWAGGSRTIHQVNRAGCDQTSVNTRRQ